jgi:hypothetical protein
MEWRIIEEGNNTQKNPDSSPAFNIWERNYRDCTAKL